MQNIINYLEAGFILATKGINLYMIRDGIIDATMIIPIDNEQIIDMCVIDKGTLQKYLVLVSQNKKFIYLNNAKIAEFSQSCDYVVKNMSYSKTMQSSTFANMDKFTLKSGNYVRIPKTSNRISCEDDGYRIISVRYLDSFMSIYTKKGNQLANMKLFVDDYDFRKIDRRFIKAKIEGSLKNGELTRESFKSAKEDEISCSMFVSYQQNEFAKVINIHKIGELHYRIETEDNVYVVTPTSTLII